MKKKAILLPLFSLVLVACGPTDKPIDAVTIQGDSVVVINESVDLDALATYEDGTSGVNDTAFNWTSSDEDVAQVDGHGVVFGLEVGNVRITATHKEDATISDDFDVEVVSSSAAIILPESVTISAVGGATSVAPSATLQLSATVLPANTSNKSVTWESSDPSKATVSASGLVTGVAEGAVVIKAIAVAKSTIIGTYNLSVGSTVVVPGVYLDYDFANLPAPANAGDRFTAETLLAALENPALGGDAAKVTAVTNVTDTFPGNGTGGAPYADATGLIKFGSSSKVGTMTFTVAANITKVSMVAAAWSTGDVEGGAKIDVNGVLVNTPWGGNTADSCKGVAEFVLTSATNTITITSAKRFRMFELTLYAA